MRGSVAVGPARGARRRRPPWPTELGMEGLPSKSANGTGNAQQQLGYFTAVGMILTARHSIGGSHIAQECDMSRQAERVRQGIDIRRSSPTKQGWWTRHRRAVVPSVL